MLKRYTGQLPYHNLTITFILYTEIVRFAESIDSIKISVKIFRMWSFRLTRMLFKLHEVNKWKLA